MDDLFIYGKLNKEIEKVTYDGKDGDYINIVVDQPTRTIGATAKVDTQIRSDSNNLITSGAVYKAIVAYIGSALNTPV